MINVAYRLLQEQLGQVARRLTLASDALAYDLAMREPKIEESVAHARLAAREAVDVLKTVAG